MFNFIRKLPTVQPSDKKIKCSQYWKCTSCKVIVMLDQTRQNGTSLIKKKKQNYVTAGGIGIKGTGLDYGLE